MSAPRIATLISGGGRTVLNLLESIRDGGLDASIAVVIADREGIKGIQRCRDAGLEVIVITGPDRDDRIDAELDRRDIDLVCLCGYLRHFRIPSHRTGRIMNIHPSLLPRHGGRGMYGDRVHQSVLASGDRTSGCTVHFVDDQYDHGPVILQRECPVQPADTADQLASRVFAEETIAYPEAIGMVLSGRAVMESRDENAGGINQEA